MSLESIVFSSKHFTDNSESNKKEEPKEKQPAWIDPDDLAMIPNPKLKNIPPSLKGKVDEIEFLADARERFNQSFEHFIQQKIWQPFSIQPDAFTLLLLIKRETEFNFRSHFQMKNHDIVCAILQMVSI